MSTKIYYAARFPLANFTEGLDYLHDRMLDNIKHQYNTLFKSIKKYGVNTNREKKFHLRETAVKDKDLFQNFLPDGGWNIWIHDNYVYAIPFGAERYYGNLWNEDGNIDSPYSWLEDFHYQNQADAPDNIPEEEYEERGEIWKKVCLGYDKDKDGQFARKLVHFVFDSSSYHWSVEC